MDSRDSNVTPPSETTTPTEPPEKTKQMEPQPVLRVTAPSQPSKNEKKAAAGRAGVAGRKAKSERLERELAEAKEALRDPAFVADPPAAEAAPIRRIDKKEEASMLYLGALVAAVGGLVYWSKFHRAEPPPPKEKKTTLKSSAGPAQQLKVAHNPHSQRRISP